jgi:hypothetical protein
VTWRELVKQYIPEASDEEIDFVLWEMTAFPVCDIETLKMQLGEVAKWFDRTYRDR